MVLLCAFLFPPAQGAALLMFVSDLRDLAQQEGNACKGLLEKVEGALNPVQGPNQVQGHTTTRRWLELSRTESKPIFARRMSNAARERSNTKRKAFSLGGWGP